MCVDFAVIIVCVILKVEWTSFCDCSPVNLFVFHHLESTGTVSMQAVAYEFVVEMTYPAPESLSTGFLNGMSSV